jgi:hypothetical protein
MAGAAIRDISMFFSVAVGTRHICCVLAWEILYFVALLCMTLRTCGLGRHGNHKGFVGIGVTVQTRGQEFAFSMERAATGALVACNAFRHNVVVILLARIIRVVFRMTPYTIDLMFSAVRLDRLKNGQVTLCALGCRKGLNLCFVRGPFGSGILNYPHICENKPRHAENTDH